MGIYIAIGAAIALILPFPISLLVALGALFLLNFIRTRRMLKRAGVDIKGLFRSLSFFDFNRWCTIQSNKILLYELWKRAQRNYMS
jgi:hypothetical protein